MCPAQGIQVGLRDLDLRVQQRAINVNGDEADGALHKSILTAGKAQPSASALLAGILGQRLLLFGRKSRACLGLCQRRPALRFWNGKSAAALAVSVPESPASARAERCRIANNQVDCGVAHCGRLVHSLPLYTVSVCRGLRQATRSKCRGTIMPPSPSLKEREHCPMGIPPSFHYIAWKAHQRTKPTKAVTRRTSVVLKEEPTGPLADHVGSDIAKRQSSAQLVRSVLNPFERLASRVPKKNLDDPGLPPPIKPRGS